MANESWTTTLPSGMLTSGINMLEILILPISARTFIVFLLSVCALFSLMANCITCYVILHSRRLQSTTNYFIISLSVSAVFVTICMIIVLTEMIHVTWLLGTHVCKLIGVFFHSQLSANAFLLVSIMTDRYYAIVLPLSCKISRTKAKNMIAGSFAAGFAMSLPMFIYYNEVRCKQGHTICAFFNSMGSWMGLGLYAIPYGLLTFVVPGTIASLLFLRVWTFVWTLNRQRGSIRGRVLQRTTNHVPRTKIKIFKLISAVSATDITTMSIIFALEFSFLTFELTGTPRYDPLTMICCLYFLDGLAKPILYVCMNSNFRRGCREVLCWSQMKCYRQELYTVTRVSIFGKKNYVTAVDVNGVTENRWENPSVFELGATKSQQTVFRHSNAI